MDIARSAKYILSALVILSGIIMGSCTAEDGAAVSSDELGETAVYNIVFMDGDRQLSSQNLKEGDLPCVPRIEDIEGARFGGWVDSKGRKALPGDTPAQGGEIYTAVYFPILDGSGPYLFTGSDGLLHPDGVLGSAELTTALNALASGAARDHFPELDSTDGDVTVKELRAVLLNFYSSEELDRVIIGYEAAAKITRSQFAAIMNTLLGRDTDARVIPTDGSFRIADLPPERSDYSQLMEATVDHAHISTGSTWRNVELPSMYEEGFMLLDGSLYCVDRRGYFIYDTVVGSLTFGYDGRYTSGDSKIDSYVDAIISDLAEINSYESISELLRPAYDYCRDNFGVMYRNTYGVGARGWEMAEALTMFESGSGNAPSYAAVFWALARGLGFEATAVSGVIGQNRLHHAWVEIEIDGTNYIFDAAAEAGALEDGDTTRDRFMLSPEWASILRYVKE